MSVEQRRFSLHRLAPVALAALGIFGAVLMIFAGLVALNHSVLPFEGWPLNAQQTGTERLTLPRAPAEAGRLRTGSGGTHAQVIDGRVSILSPAATAAALGAAVPATATRPAGHHAASVRPQHQRSHSSLPAAPKPVVVQAPVAATPAPVAAAPVPAAVTPVTQGNGHAFGHNKSRQPVATTLTTSPSRAPSAAQASAPQPSAPGHGHGKGHAYGHVKHQAPAQVPAPVAGPVSTPAVGDDDSGQGNGHGHGPPPWAHGHGKH